MIGRRGGAGNAQENGIALVVVLWVGLLVAAIAAAFITDMRTSTRLARNFVDNAEARALADGGVHLALFYLMHPDADAKWRRDGRLYTQVIPGGTLAVVIENESGKINLNTGSLLLLESLLRNAGLKADKARAITAAVGTRRRGEPRRAGGAFAAPVFVERPFAAVDALNQIPGMTPSVYRRVRGALTVHGEDELLHYPTAPRAALLAVPGMSVEAVNTFLRARSTGNEAAALDALLAVGEAFSFYQEVEGPFVTIRVLAESESGARFERVAVVEMLESGDAPFRIREWRESDGFDLPPAAGPKEGRRQSEGMS